MALILLTVTVLLGVATAAGASGPGMPRVVTGALHRNLSLLGLAFVAAHVLTTVADSYVSIGLTAAFVPFSSSYRGFWLGLGAIAFDLLLAVAVTSLLRDRMSYRAWRTVHWLSYASWPVALAHGVAAVFAVPVGSGAARLGVLCLYRKQAQELTRDQLDTLLLYADAAMMLALDDRGGLTPGSAELIGTSFSERRAEVHQATGMVSVQVGISVTDALVMLRACAYAAGRPIAEVAADVIGRRLSFADGHGPAPGLLDRNHDQNRADTNEMEGQ